MHPPAQHARLCRRGPDGRAALELRLDGRVTAEGEAEVPSLPARGSAAMALPCALTDAPGRVDLRLIWKTRVASALVTAGWELGFDQLTLRRATAPLPPPTPGAVRVRTAGREIVVSGADFTYRFDRFSGCFSRMAWRGAERLAAPMRFNVWRAPTDNDRKIRRVWEQAGYNCAQVRVARCSAFADGTAVIACDVVFAAVFRQPFLRCSCVWEIDVTGAVRLTVRGERDTHFPYLPRFGVRTMLPPGFEALEYTGYGPQESYEDKKNACWYGQFSSAVTREYVDTIKPQEHGSHTGCTQLRLAGDGVRFWAAGEQTFSFRASHVPQEQLERAAHNFELTPCDGTELCLDYRNSGIGSNSCGPALAESYALAEKIFRWEIAFGFGAL